MDTQKENKHRLSLVLALKAIQSAKALIIIAGNGISADTGIAIGEAQLGKKNINLTYRLRNQETLEFTTDDSYKRYYNYSSDLFSIPEYLSKINASPENSSQRNRLKDHLNKIIELRTPAPIFSMLKSLIKEPQLGYFIITGNVDGYFHKTGFDERAIFELNGSINHQLNAYERQLTDLVYYINKLKELNISPIILEIGLEESDLKLKIYAKDIQDKLKTKSVKIYSNAKGYSLDDIIIRMDLAEGLRLINNY